MSKFRSWVVHLSFLEHDPIVLQLDEGRSSIKYPFKFNSVWLEELEFVQLVRNHWGSLTNHEFDSPMISMVFKLKSLKAIVIKWENARKTNPKDDLIQIESDLENIYSQNQSKIMSPFEKLRIFELEG